MKQHEKMYEDIINETATKEAEDEYMASIAQRIESRRNELKYSYQDLAELTGMSKSTLQRYVSGAIRNIPISKLKALADALECSPDWLLGWSNRKWSNPLNKIFDTASKALDSLEDSHVLDGLTQKHSVSYLDDDDTVQSAIIMGKIGRLLKESGELNELLEIYALLDDAGRSAILSSAKTILKLKAAENPSLDKFETGKIKYF